MVSKPADKISSKEALLNRSKDVEIALTLWALMFRNSSLQELKAKWMALQIQVEIVLADRSNYWRLSSWHHTQCLEDSLTALERCLDTCSENPFSLRSHVKSCRFSGLGWIIFPLNN